LRTPPGRKKSFGDLKNRDVFPGASRDGFTAFPEALFSASAAGLVAASRPNP
jgi:hypothetical protein